jgi:hypothetical protein
LELHTFIVDVHGFEFEIHANCVDVSIAELIVLGFWLVLVRIFGVTANRIIRDDFPTLERPTITSLNRWSLFLVRVN